MSTRAVIYKNDNGTHSEIGGRRVGRAAQVELLVHDKLGVQTSQHFDPRRNHHTLIQRRRGVGVLPGQKVGAATGGGVRSLLGQRGVDADPKGPPRHVAAQTLAHAARVTGGVHKVPTGMSQNSKKQNDGESIAENKDVRRRSEMVVIGHNINSDTRCITAAPNPQFILVAKMVEFVFCHALQVHNARGRRLADGLCRGEEALRRQRGHARVEEAEDGGAVWRALAGVL
jgi:hypothetical protein